MNSIVDKTINIEYIKYIQNKYNIDCFYINEDNHFYIIDTCKKCNKLILNDLEYQFDPSIKDKTELNKIFKVLEDNDINFIDYYDNINRDDKFFCDCVINQ